MTVADVPAGLAAAADASLRWRPGGPFDLMQTIGTLLRGHGDPSIRTAPDGVWLAFTTPHGPATLRLATAGPRADPAVDAQAWGPGAVDAVDSVPRMLGSEDDWSGFDEPAFHATLPRMVVEARRRNLAIRLPATGRMIDSLVPTILEQKVTVIEARRGVRYLMYRHGTPAPGAGTVAPTGLLVRPTAGAWLGIPSWEWQ